MLDLQTELHEHGQPCQDLYEAVLNLKRRHDLHPCSVRPRDGLMLRKDSERDVVQELVKRFRDLPVDQQKRLPALLNSLAQLELVVGEIEAGQRDFAEVAQLVVDPISQAEAYHNVYRAALERREWEPALIALKRAVELDAEAFEPFPFARYEPMRILGAGGFGTSFLCRDRVSGFKVVIRAIRTDSLERDLDTLIREFGWIQELDHPAIIRILEFSAPPEAARPYLVTEYFEGQTLSEFIAERGRSTQRIGSNWPGHWLARCKRSMAEACCIAACGPRRFWSASNNRRPGSGGASSSSTPAYRCGAPSFTPMPAIPRLRCRPLSAEASRGPFPTRRPK